MTWDWKSHYADRLVPASEAAKAVKSGDRVVFTMCGPLMTPVAMATALAARAGELRDVTIDASLTLAGAFGVLSPEAAEAFTVSTTFAYNPLETMALSDRGPQVDYVPINMGFAGALLGRRHREDMQRRFGGDVCVSVISPPTPSGMVTFGTNLWNGRSQVRNSTIAIGEVDPSLPVVPGGDNWVPVEAFDYLVEGQPLVLPDLAGLAFIPEEELDATQACGYFVSELINDGDTVMLGAGSMPMRVSPWLESKNDLGCHTEVICPIDLVQSGQINGSRRNHVPGKVSLTALIPATEEERDFVNGNPVFDIRDMGLNNDPRYIAKNDNLVAINAPLEITLWGEIGAERVGTRFYHGVGGQLEFVMGALMSDGGRSIHATVSRKLDTRTGEWVSAIVPELRTPGVTTVPRLLADIVVTEYGVAELMGRTERERAAALIRVAHPDYREDLADQAKHLLGLGRTTFILDD
ncbi:MAG: acetyl-CoA hydrolase/transferase C-terminal domain-containing protein [Acidimicrobiales bacterium]|nr:acetyl-CoA hydrolase/transferase C-terminal domain-containing protein [Acidimicrobiales bacterium]